MGQTLPDACSEPGRNNEANWRFGKNEFEFDLPMTHPSGTFWYHAHKHGSTARQVANGMAGPLIVADTERSMPLYIRRATENGKDDIFLIQLRNLHGDENNPEGNLTLVKAHPDGGGEKNPTINMKRGEVRRFRFINAAPSTNAFVSLSVEGGGEVPPELYQTAYDGLTLNRRLPVRPQRSTDPWENPTALAPGNRTDFIIRIPPNATEGVFSLLAQPPRPDVLHGVRALQSTRISLNIRIEGQLDPPDLWSDDPVLPGPGLPRISPQGAVARRVKFNTDRNNNLAIDGERFTGVSKEPKMKLNSVGDWTVTNETNGTHPFHIHVNPFFITHINGTELAPSDPRRRWQDTIGLPPKQNNVPGSVRFLTRFETFVGKFVIHCHILGHEDNGMMQAVEVIA